MSIASVRRYGSPLKRSRSVRPRTHPSFSLYPSLHRTALATSAVCAGALLGAYLGAHASLATSRTGATRGFWHKPLLCKEEGKNAQDPLEESKPSFLSKLPTFPTIPSPSIPLPTLPDFPSVSLPDVSSILSSWSASLTSLTATFNKLQEELSLGPNSTYARIVSAGKDPTVHPELQWDASVRLGQDLALGERAYLRNRRDAMRDSFACLMDVPLEEVDVRDLPVVAIAASGGGYRAMLNTASSLEAAKESGVFDCLSFISGVSGSCWALNVLNSLGAGDVSWTLQHLRERVKEPFLQPETLITLLNTEDKVARDLLTGVILKEASKGGEISLVDAYGTLVSTRLYVPSPSLPPPPQPLSVQALKTSSQRNFLDLGQNPLPIYCTVRHDLPTDEVVEAAKKAGASNAEVAEKAEYVWFEVTPYETGSDTLGAWIPTWALGRLFDQGKSTERVPELGLSVLSGIYASAFCATLFSYFKEVQPLLASLPFFSTINSFVHSNAHYLSAIHPFPPAELPNFLFNLGGELPPTIPSSMTELRTLGFADAGMEINLPYVPLMRRQTDVIIALDASADSQDAWFQRAAEYARQYADKDRPSRWPTVDVAALFPAPLPSPNLAATADSQKSDAEQAAQKVDEAKKQEEVSGGSEPSERKGVRQTNPEPSPLGSAPKSKTRAAEESSEATEGGGVGQEKPMPESQASEPPLGRCSIWIGSTNPAETSSCRNDNPTLEDVQARDGIALAYIPLQGDEEFDNPLEVFSTWRFDYREEETDRLIRLAKANFLNGESQLKTLIKGVWLRKRKQRLDDEARASAGDA
ncbi:hypothetical protein JCM11641_002916 [Rhodosporidiobolus odoratus]